MFNLSYSDKFIIYVLKFTVLEIKDNIKVVKNIKQKQACHYQFR